MRRLGVGMTYVAGLEPLYAEVADLLDVIELEPQTFWLVTPGRDGPAQIRFDAAALAEVAALPQPKLVHSVSLPVGSARPPNPAEVELVARVAHELGAAWTSEHLAINQAHGPGGPYSTGFFLPPRQTREGVAAIAGTVRTVAAAMGRPFAIETAVNYLRPRADELPDGEFVGAVAEAADCHILLDLHNIYANERNGRQPVADFLAALPLERVIELHVAGGFELDGFWLDAHSGLVPPPVMDLLAEVLPRLPNVGAVIFEMLPAYAELVSADALRRQLAELRRIWRQAPLRNTAAPKANAAPTTSSPAIAAVTAWEDTLGALVTATADRAPDPRLAAALAGDPAIALYRTLVTEGRLGMLAGALPGTVALLLTSLGEPAVRALLARFFAAVPASLYGADEALAFAAFLPSAGLAIPQLLPTLAGERQRVLALLASGGAPT